MCQADNEGWPSDLAFFVWSEDQAQVLMLAKQVLFRLSYLPDLLKLDLIKLDLRTGSSSWKVL